MIRKEYIHIKDATLGYRKAAHELSVLKSLNLNFFSSELVGIVGLNGIGKSTLLKSIAGLIPVLNGEVFIEGKAVDEYSLEELSKKIAVVLTERIGGFNLRVFDVVAAGQMPYTNSFHRLENENRKVIQEAIVSCGIEDFELHLIHELSDGLFQKTMIAKALAQQTPIMLLDEPSAFLDYASKHSLFLLLKGLVEKQQKCVLVSSHDLDLMLKYCDKLLIVSKEDVQICSTDDARKMRAFIQISGGYL